MPAYFQILNWVDHQPIELLRKRAKRDVLYGDFRIDARLHALQIVEVKLSVRQIIRLTEPPKNGITKPTTTPTGIRSTKSAVSISNRAAPTCTLGS